MPYFWVYSLNRQMFPFTLRSSCLVQLESTSIQARYAEYWQFNLSSHVTPVLTAASVVWILLLSLVQTIISHSVTILQRWGLKIPIRACWKYSARSLQTFSAAHVLNSSPAHPVLEWDVIDMWITVCSDSEKSTTQVGSPMNSQSQLALPDRQPLPPSQHK